MIEWRPFPFSLGDRLWEIDWFGDVRQVVVTRLEYSILPSAKPEVRMGVGYFVNRFERYVNFDVVWGKSLFPTKEAADAYAEEHKNEFYD